MKVITKQDKANTVAERWKATYFSYNTSYEVKDWFINRINDTQLVYHNLLALGNKPSSEDIVSIIGNSSWTRLTCDCCSAEVDKVVSFKGMAEDEYGNTLLCEDCSISLIRVLLPTTNDDGRIDLKDKIMKGYCTHCGSKYLPCYCWNDE